MDTSKHVIVAHHLRLWHALHIEVQTTLRHSRGSTMLLAAEHCASRKRTKSGVLVDYTIWLAGYGVTPAETALNRLRMKLSPAQFRELDNGLATAAALRKARRAAYLARQTSPG
jgi:hypothetical protein